MRKIYSYLLAVVAAAVLAIPASAQKISISGQVLDASDGQPLIGAGVVLPNGTGTITDYDGKYVIQADKNATLTFSSLGYISVTEPVDGRTVINVSLSPDSQSLEEVVVLGYTTQKRAELSSAVVSVSGEKLHDVTTPDVGNMLQGKVAGVVVMNSSGQPGSSADIRIRGTGSITAGAGPLYVVDGVAGGSFNPNDIETLTVLKDASATALYGAAASGGVIVITTKNGSGDKTEVNFKASGGIKKALTGHFHPMTTEEMFWFERSMFSDVVGADMYPDYLLDNYFDWMNNCFKIGTVQNYYASVSGKAGKVNYYVSLDHYNEKGSLINTNFKRNAARLNLSAPITDRLTMSLRVNYSKTYDQGTSSWRLLEYSYYAMPWDIPYYINEDGTWSNQYLYVTTDKAGRSDNGLNGLGSEGEGLKWYTQNPSNVLHSEQYNYSKGHGESLTGDLQLVWNVTDWLTLTSINRYDTSWSYWESLVDRRTYDGAGKKGELDNTNSEWTGWGTTNLAKFYKTFGDHDINAIVGWEYGEGYTRNLGAAGANFPEGQRSLSNCVDLTSISGADYHTRTWAVLGQAQYSYLGKYVATASIRYDESYKFGPNNRGGWFPGVSAAWIISKEDFMNNVPAISFLKLRGGYGKTGNDNIPAFQYQDTFSLSAKYNGNSAAVLQRQANFELGWEEAYMASLGIDATLLNNWNFTLDLYHTINDKILLESPKAPSSGFFARFENVGKVRNMGVEFAVDGAIINTKDWGLNFGMNIGFNKNRVLELPGGNDMVMSKSEVSQILRVGEDVYSWYMPKWEGVTTTDPVLEENEDYEMVEVRHGLPTWEVANEIKDGNGHVIGYEKTGSTNNYTDATWEIVGSASPLFSGGVNLGFRWKGLTLSMNGSYMVGNKIYNKTRETMDADGTYTNLNQMSLNNGLGWVRWNPKDESTWSIATHPEPMLARNDGSNKASSRYLEDGSFFRLRNVTLAYDLPAKLIQKIRMSGARIYVSADNVLTLSRFSGMDPEVGMDSDTYHHAGLYSSNYPVPMSVVLGIDVKF